MRRVVILFGCALFLFAAGVGAQETLPYVYYYSPSENSFIVEQADSNDSHEFGSNVLSQVPVRVHGPGWSPDGQWFAFNVDINDRPSGHVIRPDSPDRVGLVELLWRTGPMNWSPDSELLFITGNLDSCDGYCSSVTYWLIEVEADALLAWLDFRRGTRSPGETPVEWSLDDGQVTFYEAEEVVSAEALSGYYQITLATNGIVIKQPISREEWNNIFVLDGDLSPPPEEAQLVSSSGRYTISGTGQLSDIHEGSVVELPTPDFGSGQDARVIEAQWDTSEEWILLGYNIWSSSAVDGVSVVNVDGTGYRELTTCGFAPACVGWLPENVDVAQIPSAAD